MWGTKSCLPADTAPDVIIISILDLKLFFIFFEKVFHPYPLKFHHL